MSVDRNPQTEDKYIVRFPEGMRDRLKAEAKANNRTLNAEIVARLEDSFSTQSSAPGPAHQLDLFTSALESKALMLSMRYDMVKLRNENLANQAHRISVESELLARKAKTDEDFQRSTDKISELDAIEAQAEQLQLEAEQIIRERDAAIAEFNAVREAFQSRRMQIEADLAGARPDKKSPPIIK